MVPGHREVILDQAVQFRLRGLCRLFLCSVSASQLDFQFFRLDINDYLIKYGPAEDCTEKISTLLLTVLTTGVIFSIEQANQLMKVKR